MLCLCSHFTVLFSVEISYMKSFGRWLLGSCFTSFNYITLNWLFLFSDSVHYCWNVGNFIIYFFSLKPLRIKCTVWKGVFCCYVSDGNVVRDHVGNTIISCTQSPNDVMQVSCTDSDKSPTESSYDLPISSLNPAPTVCVLYSFWYITWCNYQCYVRRLCLVMELLLSYNKCLATPFIVFCIGTLTYSNLWLFVSIFNTFICEAFSY